MKILHARELSRKQWILRFDVVLQHDWPIEQCLLHIRVFLWRENGEWRVHVLILIFIHWLLKQVRTFTKLFFKVIRKSFYLEVRTVILCTKTSRPTARARCSICVKQLLLLIFYQIIFRQCRPYPCFQSPRNKFDKNALHPVSLPLSIDVFQCRVDYEVLL